MRDPRGIDRRPEWRMRSVLVWAGAGAITVVIALIVGRAVAHPQRRHAQKVSALVFQCQLRPVGLAEYWMPRPPEAGGCRSKGDFYVARQQGSFYFLSGYGMAR